MMKKWIAMLLVLAMMLTCTACGENEDKGTNNNETQGNVSNETEDVATQNQEQEQEDAKLPISGEITEEMLRSYPETPAADFEYGASTDYDGILIKAYIGNDEIVVIPATIDGQPVVDVAEICFGNDSTVRAVLIPETVVEMNALFGNSTCIELVIAEGVEVIGENCFLNCSSLKKVILGDKLTEISSFAFFYCEKLDELRIPATLTSMSEEAKSTAFFGCNALTIYGEAGSYIETVANEKGIPFVAE